MELAETIAQLEAHANVGEQYLHDTNHEDRDIRLRIASIGLEIAIARGLAAMLRQWVVA